MAGYILIDLEITDPEGFQEYLKLAGPTVKQYGGKVLIGGAASETLEGDWHPHLLSVGEFESVEQALRWYNSGEYASKSTAFQGGKQQSNCRTGSLARKNGPPGGIPAASLILGLFIRQPPGKPALRA
jgi:uncharacterized protein (DUF1330 family)